MKTKRRWRRMYAISCEGIGLISGTLAYNRHEAINNFLRPGYSPVDWEEAKRAGYRTVLALVRMVKKS